MMQKKISAVIVLLSAVQNAAVSLKRTAVAMEDRDTVV